MLDNIAIKGRVRIEASDGRIIEQDNIVVNAGRDRVAEIIAGDSTAVPTHVAIGTGSTAALATDTALVTEVDRNALAASTATAGVITFRGFFSKSEANGNTIAEMGLFDQSSGGTMFCRTVLGSTIAKTSTISITVTWTWTFADA